jgi:hypothetical protein
MDLSDFGSWASIISLIIGLIFGFLTCKKTSKQNNFSIGNFGNSSQSSLFCRPYATAISTKRRYLVLS